MNDNEQQHAKTSAFIWTREFTYERLQKIQRIQRKWESLFKQPGDQGHYARYQWLGSGRGGIFNGEKFSAPIDGQECTNYLKIVTTREWFAKEVYSRALAQTRKRYPNFDAHLFIDGARVGERIIEFLSEEHELAWGHIWTSLWKIIEDESPTVREEVIIEPCSSWGYPVAVAVTKTYGNEIVADHRLITVVRHVKEATEVDYAAVRTLLVDGRQPEIDSTPVSYNFNDIREGFIELSSPELVVLNWAEARPPLSEADRELHQAAYKLDRAGVENAIARDANVNHVDEGNNSVIKNVIEGLGDHRAHCQAAEDDLEWYGGPRPAREIPEDEIVALIEFLLDQGAHPDLHGPEETPAIVDASLGCHARIVALLLKRGANAAVRWAWDSHPDDWPQAWDSPSFDAFQENCPEARTVYDLLILNRPSPIYSKEREELDKAEALGVKKISKPRYVYSLDDRPKDAERQDQAEDCSSSDQVIWELPDKESIKEWISAKGDSLVAEACVRYAMAFNSLDVDWLIGVLSPDVKYESQSVFAALVGRNKVMNHLRGKIETIRKSLDTLPRFELANTQSGEPCVAGFQKKGEFDNSWLAKPITNVVFQHDENGLISSILIITVVPPPETAILSSLCPGINSNPA
jgi:hypothetical protein